MEETAWLRKDAVLFITTNDYNEMIQLGRNQERGAFYDYISGYKLAADTLINKAIESRNFYDNAKIGMPIIYLYRQFIELYLKKIYFYYSSTEAGVKVRKIKSISHDIVKMWNEIKVLAANDNESTSIAESYITQFDSFDKGADKLRYPVDRDFNDYFKQNIFISLPNLKRCMNELEVYFDSFEAELKYNKDA